MNEILQPSPEIIQRSPEWFAARLGSLGASEVYEAIARTKTGWGASRANVMARKIVERLTGVPQDTYINAAMQNGIDTEPEARIAYQLSRDVGVVEVGLIRHPSIPNTHASPDGLIGDDGLLEIKCPQSAKHIETLLGQVIDLRYHTQMQWQMACSGRQWCDFVSYDPRMPEHMRLFVQRVDRNDERIEELEEMVRDFLGELDEKLARLRALAEPLAMAG